MVCMAGIIIGLPMAALAARSLRSLMFGISETDPRTFAAVTLAFLFVGAIAGLGPARRAAGVDPAIALRSE
jgi:ABC-type antimicrobial peptide transport system permease subunit